MRNFNGPTRQRGFFGALLSALAPSLISGFFGSKAADKQVEGGQAAINTVMGVNQPFLDIAGQTLQPLVDTALAGPDFSLAADKGRSDILKASSSLGKVHSGGTADALQTNRLMFEKLEQGTRFDQLFRLSGLSQGSATNVGNTVAGLQTSIGAARAAGVRNTGSAIGEGFGSFMDAYNAGKIYIGNNSGAG